MDRAIVYIGAIPQDTDLLKSNQMSMVGLSKLAEAIFGTASIVSGLPVSPTSPATMGVLVGAGQIYSLASLEATAYGSLAVDSTHQIVKQGVLLDAATLACAAPGTAGFSINYLIQAVFSEVDDTPVVLPYYNSANPSVPYTGPAGTGSSQNTARRGKCVVSAKAGTAATTGTQTTPAPDAGAIGLAVVTVANGAATITGANISSYTGTQNIPQGGAIGLATNGIYSKSVAGNTDVTLTSAEAAYPILVLTGALTGNINVNVPNVAGRWIVFNNTTGAFSLTFRPTGGSGTALIQGNASNVFCDGAGVIRFAGTSNLSVVNGAASLIGGVLNVPNVRQTVLQSSVDTNGLPNYITAGAALNINLAATTTNVYITAANGQTGDRVGKITADQTNVLTLGASTTNYIYATVNSDGSITLGSTTLAPIYQNGGTPAVTNGQFTFNIQQMTGYLGNGSSAPQAYVVFLGEAVTGPGTVTSVVNYALMGRYYGPWTNTLPTAGVLTTFNHNLGFQPERHGVTLENLTAEIEFAVGDHAEISDFSFRDSAASVDWAPPKQIIGRNTIKMRTGNNGGFTTFDATGAAIALTVANWKYRGWAVRGW